MSEPREVIMKRYKDAYRVAKAVGWVASAVKILGMLVGVFGAMGGFAAAEKLGVSATFGGIVGAAAGAAMYLFGIVIAATSQMQSAVLDVAVNTSPLLTLDVQTDLLVGSPSKPN